MASDVLSRPAPPPDLVLSYGPGPEHVADVRLPPQSAGALPAGALPAGGLPPVARPAPLVVFLHGGFWRVAFDRTHTGPLATALAAAGFAVAYRSSGAPGSAVAAGRAPSTMSPPPSTLFRPSSVMPPVPAGSAVSPRCSPGIRRAGIWRCGRRPGTGCRPIQGGVRRGRGFVEWSRSPR